MIRLNFLLVVFLVFAIVIISETTAFGKEYLQYEVFADSDFSHTRNVCIDPGHGGPTAQKFGNNGDGQGTYGCCYNLSEQWVNLQVAYALRDSLYLWGSCPNQIVMGVIMTREGQTDIPTYPYGLWWRVRVANYANMGSPVNEFISIHHNGFDSMSTAPQGTESRWWNSINTDSSATRDTTSKLARKVSMKIHDNFNTDAECYECYEHRPTLPVDFFVLRNSRPPSVISEASDIHAYTHWEEELRFMDSTVFWHAMVEAGGINRGWCSYRNNSGFVTIRNSAITGNDGYLWTRWDQLGSIQWASPYHTVWEEGEQGWISFPYPYQYIGGVKVYFHHIEELEHGYYSTYPDYFYVVPHCSTHTIVAYWTGGPYSAQLYYPNGGELWHTCEQRSITWNASVGVNSTTRMNVYLSRDGGNNFAPISIDLPNTGSYTWKVSGLASQQCKIRVVAHDTAGNQASDVSDQNFTIQGLAVSVNYPNGMEIWHIGEQRTITWSSAYLCTTSHVDIYLSRDGGSNFAPIISDLLNTGSYVWTVTGPYSANCRVKVIVDDIFGNSAWDVSNQDFSISASGNNNPAIDTGLHCKYAQQECNECIKLGESFTLEVHAHDLDGDSLYYVWHCGPPPSGGHFSNGQNLMITAQNYVVYTAPSQKGKDYSDFLSVAVMDVRGGQTWTSGTLWIYDPATKCLCGDFIKDLIVDASDLIFLLNYFFAHGPSFDPTEIGDVNNDCVVDVSDLIYLLNYLFAHGPQPECCWIHY